MAIVFVKSKYILLKDRTYAVEEYFFACLPVAEGEKNITEKIILFIYKEDIEIRKERDLFAFYKVNLLLLWFLNTISCHKQLVLACLADDSAYKCFALDISCCDNCFYSSYESANVEEDSGVRKWKLYNIVIRYFLHYLETNEWCKY